MGVEKFVAGRIHPMRVAKSDLAAHPSWFDKNPETTCPRCRIESESFQHAMLPCPPRSEARDLLLEEVSSLGHDAALWTDPDLIRAFG